MATFNSRTSCEVRLATSKEYVAWLYFNSRTSCEVRQPQMKYQQHYNFISTHAPLARCDYQVFPTDTQNYRISTHAPLARCDIYNSVDFHRVCKISTHAPLARCDRHARLTCWHRINFNSRTSCEVRHPHPANAGVRRNFNSRTSCEVRREFDD